MFLLLTIKKSKKLLFLPLMKSKMILFLLLIKKQIRVLGEFITIKKGK